MYNTCDAPSILSAKVQNAIQIQGKLVGLDKRTDMINLNPNCTLVPSQKNVMMYNPRYISRDKKAFIVVQLPQKNFFLMFGELDYIINFVSIMNPLRALREITNSSVTTRLGFTKT